MNSQATRQKNSIGKLLKSHTEKTSPRGTVPRAMAFTIARIFKAMTKGVWALDCPAKRSSESGHGFLAIIQLLATRARIQTGSGMRKKMSVGGLDKQQININKWTPADISL